MKRGVNKVIIVGNLGKDPECRYSQNGSAITNFSVATSETWKDKSSGEERSRTEWHRIVIFGKLAEVAAEYLQKGSQVYLEGELHTRKWVNQQGQDQYTTEIVLQGYDAVMQMLGGTKSRGDQQSPQQPQGTHQQQGGQRQQQQQYAQQAQQQRQQQAHYDEPPMDFDDDIPFAHPFLQYPALIHCC